ncbi:MAG TPA: BON domain-containing protein [Methylomirabilota bacterium]|nr:BON domain-containing protein [Methylomirabilota bacterium]
MTKLGAGVVMGLALAAAPAWVGAADETKKSGEKSTTESVKGNVSDSWITAKTKIALMADNRVPGTTVSVETQKGMVYLRGKVESDAAKSAAEEVARGVEGVQAVRNELQVVPATAKKTVEAKDDEITKQVKDRLKNDARLKSVDVRTDNGVVTLQGKVSNINDSVRASQMAREVPGVRSVRNDTTYESPRASMSDADKPGAMDKVSDKMDRAKDKVMGKADDTKSRTDRTMDARGSDMRSQTAMGATEETHVRLAQERLKHKGFDPGPIDGIWGPRTAAAVAEFQRKEGLTVTSRLDADTLGKLDVGVGGASPRKPQTP